MSAQVIPFDDRSPRGTALRMLREARNAIPGLDGHERVVECARYRQAAAFSLDGDYTSAVAMLSGKMALAPFERTREAEVIRFPKGRG